MGRWIRLETGWSNSDWLVILSAECRLAWVQLLCYVKQDGLNGTVKAINPLTASRLWLIGEESVRQMIMAAEQHGALRVDGGKWIIAKWGDYQGDATGAERQKRFKEKKQDNGGNALVTATREENNIPPISPKGDGEPSDERQESRTSKAVDHSVGVEVPPDLKSIPGLELMLHRRFKQRYSKPKTRYPTRESVEAEIAILRRCRDPIAVLERAIASGWQGLNAKGADFGERQFQVAEEFMEVELEGTGKRIKVPIGCPPDEVLRLKESAMDRLRERA